MIGAVLRFPVCLLALSLQLGCAASQEPPGPRPEAAPFRPVTDVKQTMAWILDPATDVIWESAGTIITAEGETDLAPTSEAAWENVRNQAATVAESGNLLMLPSRSSGPAWDAYAQALVAAGQRAMAAAQARDADALFDAGGQLYVVCRGCHAQFLIPEDGARKEDRP